MKRTLVLITFIAVSLIFLNITYAANKCGAIWTTDATGEEQNKNQYLIGENVYLNADNFNSNTRCALEIKKLPHDVVKTSNLNTNSEGQIDAALIYASGPADTRSEFQVGLTCGTCNEKHDNFRVGVNVIPEFSTLTALVALTGALGFFIYQRKRNGKK